MVELENLKQQMALQNQSIKKYQQNVEKIQLGHKIALAKANNSIQPEKNISSVAETDSRKVLEEINMNKENTTMAIPPQIEKFIEKAPLWSFKNLYFVYQMQSSLAEIKDELSVEKKLSEDLSKQMKILQEQMRKIQGQYHYLKQLSWISKASIGAGADLGFSRWGGADFQKQFRKFCRPFFRCRPN